MLRPVRVNSERSSTFSVRWKWECFTVTLSSKLFVTAKSVYVLVESTVRRLCVCEGNCTVTVIVIVPFRHCPLSAVSTLIVRFRALVVRLRALNASRLNQKPTQCCLHWISNHGEMVSYVFLFVSGPSGVNESAVCNCSFIARQIRLVLNCVADGFVHSESVSTCNRHCAYAKANAFIKENVHYLNYQY